MAVVLVHQVQEIDSAAEVVFVVVQRLGDTFPDCFEASEVDAGIESRSCLEHGLHR